MEEEIAESTTATIDSKVDNDHHGNTELRERFLRFLQWLPNRSVNVQLFGDIRVGGKLVAVEPTNFDYYLVDDLETPMGLIEHAALRTRDTIYLEIPLNDTEDIDTTKIMEKSEQSKCNSV